MSIDRGTPSFLTPSSSAVRPQRSSDSVKTSLAFLKVPSSRAICSTVSTITRLNSSASSAGTLEKAAVRLTSAIVVDLQDVRVGLGGVGADGEADRLAHFLFARARCPGTCQVALGSVGVAGGEIRRQVAQKRRLLVERPLLVLPARDHLLFERHTFSFFLNAGGGRRGVRLGAGLQTLGCHAYRDGTREVERRVRLFLEDNRV